MTTNAQIAYINFVDTGTVTASTEATLAPANMVQNPHVGRPWRSTAAPGNIVVDFGSLKLVDTVAVMGITGSTYRIRLSSSDSTGAAGDIYDSGVLSVDQIYRQAVALITSLPSPNTSRYLRVDLTSAGSYVEIGRVFAGARYTFMVNAAFGWQRQWVDFTTRLQMKSGGVQTFQEGKYARIEALFEWVDETERTGIVESIDITNGLHTDVLFILDPESTNLARDAVWGLMADMTPVVHRTFDTYQKQYAIEQRL